MIPSFSFFAVCFLSLILLSFWLYLILEATYKLTRYHKKENEILRFLRVGRIYLLLSSPLTISLYVTYGKELVLKHGVSSLWAFYCAAYVILIAARIMSNPNKHFVDRGWEFHKRSTNEARNDDDSIKEEYISSTLKPRLQGIVMSLLFIISSYILVKALILMLTCGSLKFPLNKITYDDLQSIVYMTLGVVPAVLFSEIFLKVVPPQVTE